MATELILQKIIRHSSKHPSLSLSLSPVSFSVRFFLDSSTRWCCSCCYSCRCYLSIHGNSFHVIPQMLFNYLRSDTDWQMKYTERNILVFNNSKNNFKFYCNLW